ncbi:type II restriction endonuclease, partial [Natronococcus sp.]|uniref:type II restriction endonuclease n=1 Tax=Natronococcus sp. TaxID=35747 RepID=UPI003A4D9CD4
MTRTCHTCVHDRRWSRRRLLTAAGTTAAVGLAGCLGSDDDASEEPAEPIALDEGATCDACGMVIEEHYGPAGQLFYSEPEDRDGPARFDSLTELVAVHEERVARGEELREAFATDYSSVEYRLEERDGTTYVSTHVEADAFADATELVYVVGSEVEGAMGEEFVPFSSRDDASAFAEEHGFAVVLAEHQNYYPDISFVLKADESVKYAIDFKTTYRRPDKPWLCNGFTLGSHGKYFQDRTSTKNIQFPYGSYAGHFCLGIIYDRAECATIDETRAYPLEDLRSISSVISNIQFFVAEKWRIAGDRGGSGNT